MSSLIILKKLGASDPRTHGKPLCLSEPKFKKKTNRKHKHKPVMVQNFLNKYKVVFVGRRLTVFAKTLQDAKQESCVLTGLTIDKLKEIRKI